MSKYISKISQKIVKMLLQYDVITEDDYEVYIFGVYQNIVLIINLLTSFTIFALAGLIVEGILFSVFYSLLRSYAGGYHSQSLLVCYVLSVLVTVVIAYIVNNINISYLLLIIYLISMILIWRLAPVDTRNKRLDEIEKTIYMKKVRYIIVTINIIMVFFYIFHYVQGIIMLILAVTMETVMLIAGKLDNYLENRERRTV